ncbi:hypothetical protein WM24_27475 [Burkholderia ubonensis]|uniref:hypothetical protein n=1 Tax=Burkholderia ubonensis TaxID=101571 RepID=UPI0007583046|nr:hypothetical protein [Burkholderia ubonensis]KWN79261.1 hypothetical protein WM24_27475 [Burkholderia ubonensis]
MNPIINTTLWAIGYAITVLRKLVFVFVVAPALMFFLLLGADSRFNADNLAKELVQITTPDLPHSQADVERMGPVVGAPATTQTEVNRRVADSIRNLYWMGVFLGAISLVISSWSKFVDTVTDNLAAMIERVGEFWSRWR